MESRESLTREKGRDAAGASAAVSPPSKSVSTRKDSKSGRALLDAGPPVAPSKGRDRKGLLGRFRAGLGNRFSKYGNTKGAAVGEPEKPAKLRRKLEDDDDSEVEVMSMSSDEEGGESSKDFWKEAVGEGQQIAVPASLRIVRKVQKALGDAAAEEEEASKWEDVDEDMLERHIRDFVTERISTTGGAHVTQAETATDPAAPRVDLSQLLSLEDPMGLGPLDMDKLCLAQWSSSMAPPPRGMKPEMIVNFEESFDPALYLARVHSDTPTETLKAGCERIHEALRVQERVMQQLVREHFEIFLNCRATIDDIERNIHSMRQEGTTEYLSKAIAGVDAKASNAVGELLRRQGQVDRIRSVQGLLLRFRTLFRLPGLIRGLMKDRDYEGAVHEYLKAKSINIPGQSKILHKVEEQVEVVVLELCQVLYDRMTDAKADNATVESSMWLLMKLDPNCDPVWDFLCHKELCIRGLLQGCVAEHESKIGAAQRRQQERREEAERWRQLQESTRQQVQTQEAIDLSTLMNLEDRNGPGREPGADKAENPELYSLLVRRLTAVLIEHLPKFWRTALLIFSGKLANFPDPSSPVVFLASNRSSATLRQRRSTSGMSAASAESQEAAVGGGPYRKRSQLDFLVLVMGVLGLYESKVMDAFQCLARLQGSMPQMRSVVAEVGRALAALSQSAESAPAHAVQLLQSLKVELTSSFVQHVRNIMRETSARLAQQEDWVPSPPTVQPAPASLQQTTEIPHYDISMFPVRFQLTLSDCLDNVHKVLVQLRPDRPPVEPRVAESLLATEKRLFDELKLTFYESFLDASEALAKLAQEVQEEEEQKKKQRKEKKAEDKAGKQERQEEAGEEEAGEEEEEEEDEDGNVVPMFEGLRPGVPLSSQSQKLLMLLSNAGFLRCVTALELVQKFHFLWADARTPVTALGPAALSEGAARVLEDIDQEYQDRETDLCDQYIAVKATKLGTPVIRYFLDGTTWSAAPPVKGLRDAALDLILPLVAVHAEVYSGCSPLVEPVIRTLAEGLMDALLKVASEHPHVDLSFLDPNAFCQLYLELSYFDFVLAHFSTELLISITSQLKDMLLDRTMQTVASKAAGGAGAGAEDASSRGSGRRMGKEEYSLGEERDVPTPQNEDHLKSIANSLTNDLLPQELRRTRINVLCLGGSNIDKYLEGMEATTGLSPGASYNRISSSGALDAGGLSQSGLERIPSVSSTGSGSASAHRHAGAYSSVGSASEMGLMQPGSSLASSLPSVYGAGVTGTMLPSGPMAGPALTPGSYGHGAAAAAEAAAGATGALGTWSGASRVTARSTAGVGSLGGPMQGHAHSGQAAAYHSQGYAQAAGSYAMQSPLYGTPEAVYGMPAGSGGPYGGMAAGGGYTGSGAVSAAPTTGSGRMYSGGHAAMEYGESYHMHPSEFMQASAGMPKSGSRGWIPPQAGPTEASIGVADPMNAQGGSGRRQRGRSPLRTQPSSESLQMPAAGSGAGAGTGGVATDARSTNRSRMR